LYRGILSRRKHEKNHMPLKKIRSIHSEYSGQLDVLLLGDSVTERVSSSDKDQRNLGEMLGDAVRHENSYCCMSYSAYNMEIYYLILLACQCMHFKIEKVIIPINLRSFSSQWQNNPLFKCAIHIREMRRYLQKQGCAGKYGLIAPPKGIGEFLQEKVSYPILPFQTNEEFFEKISHRDGNLDNEAERRKIIFIYNYMFALSSTNPRLRLMNEICSVASQIGAQLIFYLTPINIEGGRYYVGEDFAKSLELNVRVLQDQFTTAGGCTSFPSRCHDYSRSLDSSFFFNKYEATEHLNELGRSTIARNLVDELAN
jgi:hypothetical protein